MLIFIKNFIPMQEFNFKKNDVVMVVLLFKTIQSLICIGKFNGVDEDRKILCLTDCLYPFSENKMYYYSKVNVNVGGKKFDLLRKLDLLEKKSYFKIIGKYNNRDGDYIEIENKDYLAIKKDLILRIKKEAEQNGGY